MTQALRHILTVNTSTCVVGLFFKVPANVRSGQYSKVQAGKRSLGRGDGGARNVSVRDVQHHRESVANAVPLSSYHIGEDPKERFKRIMSLIPGKVCGNRHF